MPDTALPPLPPPVSAERLEALVSELRQRLPGLAVVEAGEELARLSTDCNDFSPVLRPLLRGRTAQLAVKARTVDEVVAVAAACARQGVPLTPRGAGTGNYGQCVPLAGGLVLDLTALAGVRGLEEESGIVEAEAGCVLADLERFLSPRGRALRLVPSTCRTATVGGFIAGGSGGIGSLRWGFLRDAGNLLGLEVVTVEPTPRRLRLDAAESAPLHHAYGTNGILTAVRLATTEAVGWRQVVAGFSDWEAALEVARELPTTALLLDALCLLEAPVAERMPWPLGCPPPEPGEHRLLLLAAPDTEEVLPGWLARRGGDLRWQAPQGQSRGVPLRELGWNHTTLHWRAREPAWTYLQMLLPRPEAPLLAAVRERWGGDVLWHLEGVRQQGVPRLAALPLVRRAEAAELAELMAFCGERGAVNFDAHVIAVEDGGLGVIDADQVAAKARHDPAGLLNPGKLRGWLSRTPG